MWTSIAYGTCRFEWTESFVDCNFEGAYSRAYWVKVLPAVCTLCGGFRTRTHCLDAVNSDCQASVESILNCAAYMYAYNRESLVLRLLFLVA